MVILREEEERACVLVDVVNWGRENLIVSVKAGEAPGDGGMEISMPDD